MAASTRCSPDGPVPRPRPTTADAGRWRPERRRRHPDYVSRRGARSNTHPAPLGSTSRQPRWAWDDAVDRHRLASPTGPTSRLRHGQHVAPNSVHHKGLGPTETGGGRPVSGPGLGPPDLITGRPTVAVAGWSVAVFAQTASRMPILRHVGSTTPWPRHSGHRRNDHTVLGRVRRASTTPAYTHRGRPSGPVARESVPTRFHAMPGAHFGHPVFRGSRGAVHTSQGCRRTLPSGRR